MVISFQHVYEYFHMHMHQCNCFVRGWPKSCTPCNSLLGTAYTQQYNFVLSLYNFENFNFQLENNWKSLSLSTVCLQEATSDCNAVVTSEKNWNKTILFQFYVRRAYIWNKTETKHRNDAKTIWDCFRIVLVFFYISHVTTSEIKLKQNCFVSVFFQM